MIYVLTNGSSIAYRLRDLTREAKRLASNPRDGPDKVAEFPSYGAAEDAALLSGLNHRAKPTRG